MEPGFNRDTRLLADVDEDSSPGLELRLES